MYIFENIEKDKITGSKVIKQANKIGIEKLVINIVRNESHEINVHNNIIDLFRTTFSENIYISGYINHKKGSISINSLTLSEIEKQLIDLKSIIDSSIEDDANEIPSFQDKKEFVSGNLEFSKNEMVTRFEEFINESKGKYSFIKFENATLDYSRGYSYYLTSNGTEYLDKKGRYSIMAVFSSNYDGNYSSFNYFDFSKKDLTNPILYWENIDKLLFENTEQIYSQSFSDKFEGSIIFSPQAVEELISFLFGNISDLSIISGTSIYKNSVGQKISSDILTIESDPLSDLFVTKNYHTYDGFLTEPYTIVKNGILNGLLLSYYGSLKTRQPRAKNYGTRIIVKGKTTKLDQIIKKTNKGIFLGRISGDDVSSNGDFSALAKNSFLIKNGEILFPIKETMISGNYAQLLKNISDISSEYINDGYSIYPYIKADGAIIIGN